MSETIVECPGCLSPLKFNPDANMAVINCPRCDEELNVASLLESAIPNATPAVTTREDFVDPDAVRAKRETLIMLGVIGVGIFICLIAFPGAINYLVNGERAVEVVDQPAAAVAEKSDAIDNPLPRESETTGSSSAPRQPQEESKTSETLPAIVESTPPESARQQSVPEQANPSTAGEGAVLPPDRMPTPNQGDPHLAAKKHAGLKYAWKRGSEFYYQLKIEADASGTKHIINGSCTYTVKNDGVKGSEEAEGSGTGFVISPEGYLATCDHVVENAKLIEATVGKKTYPARVILRNPRVDLAIIKIDAEGLAVSRLGDSDNVQLAETVRAFGFPLSTVLGTGVKVATGAVAGIVMDPDHGRQIQTDAPINPGNSGGPIVNSAGNVIGIASSKIASHAASSVGFAVPVNELKKMMEQRGIALAAAKSNEELDGPTLAKQVTPTVAFIKVRSTSGGKVYDVAYDANFRQSQSFNPRNLRFGGFPMIPSTNHDRGVLKVNAVGEVIDSTGDGNLPFVLGSIGRFFIEPLASSNEDSWTSEFTTELRIIQREEADPFRGMRPRSPFSRRGGFSGRGGFGPFAPPAEEKTVKRIPAKERTVYRLGDELNNRITIHKTYEFDTTDDAQQPYLKVRGTGDIVFDKTIGMPTNLSYTATITQHDEDGSRNRLPVRINYNLRDPEEVKRERAARMAELEETKKRQQKEKSEPNPELIDTIIAEIRKAEGGHGAHTHMKRLASLVIVPEKREAVLKIANNHRRNSNDFVSASAALIVAKWATDEQVDELIEITNEKHHLSRDAKKLAVQRLAGLEVPGFTSKIIDMMSDQMMRSDLKKILIGLGEPAEQAVLDKLDDIKNGFVKRDLIEILQKVGTKDCIPMLEALATGKDISIKFAARRALDAVRSRQ